MSAAPLYSFLTASTLTHSHTHTRTHAHAHTHTRTHAHAFSQVLVTTIVDPFPEVKRMGCRCTGVCVCLCVCVYVHARLRACEGSVLQGLHAPNPCFTDWVFALHHLLGANLFRGNRDKRAKRWQMNACECMRARLCVCVCACASMCVCGCTSVLTPSSIHPPIHHNHHTPSHTA